MIACNVYLADRYQGGVFIIYDISCGLYYLTFAKY